MSPVAGLGAYLAELCDRSFKVLGGRYPPELMEFLNVDLSRAKNIVRRRSEVSSEGRVSIREGAKKMQPGWLVYGILLLLRILRLPFMPLMGVDRFLGNLIADLDGGMRDDKVEETGELQRFHLASSTSTLSSSSEVPSEVSVRSTATADVSVLSTITEGEEGAVGVGCGAVGVGCGAGVTHSGGVLTLMSPAAQQCYDFLKPTLEQMGRRSIYVLPPGAVTGFETHEAKQGGSWVTIKLDGRYQRMINDFKPGVGDVTFEVQFAKEIKGRLVDGCLVDLDGVFAKRLPLTVQARVAKMVLPKPSENKCIFVGKVRGAASFEE